MKYIVKMNVKIGYIAIFIAILGWGLSTTFIDLGLKHIAAIPFLAYRFVFTVLIISPYILYKRHKEIGKLIRNKWVWLVGLSESSGLIFQYYGQSFGASAGLSALLSMMFLIIVPILAPFFVNDRIKRYHVFGIILGIIGVFFITTEGNLDNLFTTSLLAPILLLMAAFSYAVYIVSTSRVTTIEAVETDVFSLFYVVMLIISIASLSLTITTGTITLPNLDALFWILMLVIFSTIIAFLGYFKALETISANTASILLIVQLLIPFTIDVLFLKIVYSVWVYSGALLVVFAILLVTYFSMKKDFSSKTEFVIAD